MRFRAAPSRPGLALRPRAAPLLIAGCAGLLALSAAGCGGDSRAPDTTIAQGGAAGTEMPAASTVLAALAPVRLRIHPLTRLERDETGRLRLVCYLELVDRFGHACKWLGQSRVELYRPSDAALGETSIAGAAIGGGAPLAGGEVQQGLWNADLAEPDGNAEKYDWVTRTYRLELVGLPDWVERFERGQAREPWITLRAYFVMADASASGAGGERRLEASFRLRRAN